MTMDDDRDFASSFTLFVGVLMPIVVAGLLVGVRGSILNANVALVLMTVVVLVAAIGGRSAGLITAASATLAFDFFHTVPYNSLTITSSDDVETAVLLLIGGLVVGQVAARARATREQVEAGRSEIQRIHRIADLAAQGSDPAAVIDAATEELMKLLGLAECRYETPPYERTLEKLERSGVVVPASRPVIVTRMGRRGLELPAEGVELPVLHRGRQVGRFVLVPMKEVGASLEQRVVAVAVADQVGAVIEPEGEERA